MDIKKFERANEIKNNLTVIKSINNCIKGSGVSFISSACGMMSPADLIEVPKVVANVILNALERYKEELEIEFEVL